jgi:hypothetical protein
MADQPIPFEIYLTITDLPPNQVDRFKELCVRNDGKPLLIELGQGEHARQPMFTKAVHASHLPEAIVKAFEYAYLLNKQGFQTSRIKIETLFHYSERFRSYSATSGESYFEWHGKVELDRIEQLLEVCTAHQAHLSRNSLKDEHTIRFVTLREYGPKASFQRRLDALVSSLQQGGWLILKQQSEYCLYDTNTGLDNGWLTNSIE